MTNLRTSITAKQEAFAHSLKAVTDFISESWNGFCATFLKAQLICSGESSEGRNQLCPARVSSSSPDRLAHHQHPWPLGSAGLFFSLKAGWFLLHSTKPWDWTQKLKYLSFFDSKCTRFFRC